MGLKANQRAGNNLKALIKESKWHSQERFAKEAMGVNPSTVRRWIAKGINDIRVIEKLSIVLKVSLEDILK